MVRKAYKDISMVPDASSVTWKFSGWKNDIDMWKGRGTRGGRREGRTRKLELVEAGRRFGRYHGRDWTVRLVSPETNDPGSWNPQDAGRGLTGFRLTG